MFFVLNKSLQKYTELSSRWIEQLSPVVKKFSQIFR